MEKFYVEVRNCDNCVKSDVCKNKDIFLKAKEQEEFKKYEKYDWMNINLSCRNHLSKDDIFLSTPKISNGSQLPRSVEITPCLSKDEFLL